MNNNKKNIKYFDYASVDFLIDKNGVPVFMEANDNTLAPFYIEKKNELTKQVLKGSNKFVNVNSKHKDVFISCFDNYFKRNEIKSKKGKNIAILCKRRNHPVSIENEIQYLIRLLGQHGYNAKMCIPEECRIENGYLTIKNDQSIPSLVFRRNFSFPPSGSIKQPVINDLMVRKISGNKFLTHQVIEPLIRNGEAGFRQPKTYHVKDRNSLMDSIGMFVKNGFDCVAKPNYSYGGDGFFYFSKRESISEENNKIASVISRIEKGEEYLVQERIETSLFKSGNNKEYCFDIRLMIYGGQFAGIEGRRSDEPFNYKLNEGKSLVTNISSGGKDLLVISSKDESYNFISERLVTENEVELLKFEVDSNVLVLGNKLFSTLKQAAESIVRAIDSAI
ncbi:MAG: hypothetical protein BWY74_03192 [Firmicutes bacterium ADurb.Bin419]|nr:MAG: hypothetical protein BWY74_03192 [Firmicutes bacterium ADurb.Bin419]